MLIATLAESRLPDLERAAAAAEPHADLLEVRLDLLEAASLARLEDLAGRLRRPWVAACRRLREGGRYEGDEESRRSLLVRAAAAGAAYLDVEHGSVVADLIGRLDGPRFILSHHDLAETPGDLPALARRMGLLPGVSLLKIVTRAVDLRDNLKMRDLLAAGATPVPLAAFCLGAPGQVSRILALSWGSAAIYGSAGSLEAAPGQIPVEELACLYRVRSIGPETRLVGILGSALGHSLSPRVHNAAYAALDLDFVYLPLESAAIGPACDLGEALPLRGLSVTLPHKVAMLEHLDDLEPLARRVGAVNTVLCDHARRVGVNTDASGGIEPLHRRLDLAGLPVAILGNGGAARALLVGLLDAGARVKVFGRSAARAAALGGEFGVPSGPVEDLAAHPYRVLINATPVGMAPDREGLPLPSEWLRGDLVYDLVYTPRPTRLLREAAARGLQTLDGLEMFLAQAEEQFLLFTDREPPRDVMRREALASLAGAAAAAVERGGVA